MCSRVEEQLRTAVEIAGAAGFARGDSVVWAASAGAGLVAASAEVEMLDI